MVLLHLMRSGIAREWERHTPKIRGEESCSTSIAGRNQEFAPPWIRQEELIFILILAMVRLFRTAQNGNLRTACVEFRS